MSEKSSESDRRASRRRMPKSSAKVRCVVGKSGLGSNVAVKLLDVSETGIRLILNAAVEGGQNVEITLEAMGDRRPTVMAGQVVWCVPLADGNYCVAVHFAKPLNYAILQAVGSI